MEKFMESKPKILFVTQSLDGDARACGIGLIGALLGQALLTHETYNFDIIYTNHWNEIIEKVNSFNPDAIIYNYAPGSTPWLDEEHPRSSITVPQLRIMHDMYQKLADEYTPEKNFGWKYIIADDPSVTGNDMVFTTNRLIPEFTKYVYQEQDIPIIGFQGFGAPHKGLHKLAHKIQEEFDEAIFRLHIPCGYFEDLYGGVKGYNAYARAREIREIITKPGITVEITHDLMETNELVDWLAHNTINCYFYDYLNLAGIASSPDYALAAKRPIALTKSHQFRNFWNIQPSIFIEDKSIKEIIQQGTEPLEYYYKAYSKESVLQDYDRILRKVLNIN